MNVRHYVIIRRDLQLENISVGLFAAQVSHITDNFLFEGKRLALATDYSPLEVEWADNPVLIVLGVNTFEELQLVKKKALDAQLPVSVWEDTVPSNLWKDEFIKCVVGISIGPVDTDKAKLVVGNLPTY